MRTFNTSGYIFTGGQRILLNLREILEPAVKDSFTVEGFNITGGTMSKTTVEKAQYREALAITQVSPNGPQSSEQELYLHFSVHLQHSRNSSVLHYDHSRSYKGCIRVIQAGFTSVTFDDSQMEYDQSVECICRVVEMAHGAGVSAEREIGTVEEAGGYLSGTVRGTVYTSSELAKRFVEDAGMDALAVFIDAVHGILPRGYASELQLGLLKELAAAVSVPLVLHGDSGTPRDEVAAAYRAGIYKVNIFSEFKHVYHRSVGELVTNHPTLVSPTRILKDTVQGVRNVAGTGMQVLGSTGKPHYYRKYWSLRGVHNVYRYQNSS